MQPHTVRQISSGLIIATIIIWIIWDIPAAIIAGTYGTESAVIRDWATAHPSFGLSIGILAGHWFWNVDEVKYPQLMWVAWALIATLLIVDIAFALLPPLYPLWPFLSGMVVGRILWPMDKSQKDR